jgi:hypothetical protein
MSENHISRVISWHFKHCQLCVMLLPLVPHAHSEAYLALVGPPPLRFEAVVKYGKDFSWMPAILSSQVIVSKTNIPSVTATNLITNAVIPPLAEPQGQASVPPPPENLSTNSPPQTQPANDLLVITPEMLVDYFKPNNTATNSNNVRVVAPVEFTPPATATMPSSQAIYQSQ